MIVLKEPRHLLTLFLVLIFHLPSDKVQRFYEEPSHQFTRPEYPTMPWVKKWFAFLTFFFLMLFEWYPQDCFFGKHSNRPMINNFWVSPLRKQKKHILDCPTWTRCFRKVLRIIVAIVHNHHHTTYFDEKNHYGRIWKFSSGFCFFLTGFCFFFSVFYRFSVSFCFLVRKKTKSRGKLSTPSIMNVFSP